MDYGMNTNSTAREGINLIKLLNLSASVSLQGNGKDNI